MQDYKRYNLAVKEIGEGARTSEYYGYDLADAIEEGIDATGWLKNATDALKVLELSSFPNAFKQAENQVRVKGNVTYADVIISMARFAMLADVYYNLPDADEDED